MVKYAVFLIVFLFAMTANAMWQCPAIDKYGQFYAVNNVYVKMSVYKSLDLCKKQSQDPASCMVERAFCSHIGYDGIAKSHWQCFAFDKNDKKYPSGPYINRYQAASAAESLCARLSKSPSSCYVRLFTCEMI